MTNIMKKFKRRSFGSGSRLEQNNEEAPPLDLSKDAAENMKDLLTEITRKEHMANTKRMGFLNNFSQFVRSVPPTSNFGLSSHEIVACLRVALLSPSKEVRAAGFRAFRHLLTDEENMKVFLQHRLDIFISKSLDLPPAAEVERVQALRLVRKMIYLCPHLFPLSLAMTLVSISNDASQDKDRMSRACLGTLCELAVQNVEIAAYAGVIGTVVKNSLDCQVPRMNESWIATILYLFNHPKFRRFVRRHVELETILSPFTDILYIHTSDLPEQMIKEDRITKLSNAKLALMTILRSWAGLIFLCGNDISSLTSILGVFRLPYLNVRRTIIDMLYEIFCLKQPNCEGSCDEALESVDPSSFQESWKLNESFLLGEAQAVLTHKAQSSRTNLTESFLSLLLCAFLEAGIIEDLIEVITTSDDDICLRGSILLGELLHMGNILLPLSYSDLRQCLPSLITLASDLGKTVTERGKASACIGYLKQLHQIKKRGTIPNSLFMEQLLLQSNSSSSNTTKGKNRQDKEKDYLDHIWKEENDVQNAIRDCQILAYDVSEFTKWDWVTIGNILESPKMTTKKPDEPLFSRFIKRLTVFFKPSQKYYSCVKKDDEMAKTYSQVALQLTEFLLSKDEQPEGERLLLEILQDLRDSLLEACQSGIVSGILSSGKLNETLSRDYFLIIGKLSSTARGEKVLHKIPGLFQYLFDICSMNARESLVKLIISCFDYGRDRISRVLLTKSLASPCFSTRLYATQFLRILLRIESAHFSNWGIVFLTNQIHDDEIEIQDAALDILEEACEDEANLQRLIEVKPLLLHLGEKGIRLLSRYASVPRGFQYLEEVDYLNTLIDLWRNSYNRDYVDWIEMELTQAFSNYEKSGSDGNYVRRSSEKGGDQRKDVYIFPHLYGELAKHTSGIEKIQEKNLLTDAINVVMQQVTETSYDINKLKSALWAIGHIGSTKLGINLLLAPNKRPSQSTPGVGSFSKGGSFSFEPATGENDDVNKNDDEDETPDVIELIVTLASHCQVYTVRGTCFFVLGLLATSTMGADKLEELDWECVRHKGSDIWPVVEHDVVYHYEPNYSDDEEENDVSMVQDIVPAEEIDPEIDPNHDMLSGVYLGDMTNTEDMEVAPPSFDYQIYKFGEDKERKKKKGKIPTSDESRYLQSVSKQEQIETNMQVKCYDVDESGKMYEKKDSGFIPGTDDSAFPAFIYYGADGDNAGGIFLGDDDTLDSESTLSDNARAYKSADEYMPFLFGINNSDTTPVSPTDSGDIANTSRMKPCFDDAGIYLGEEVDDSIEANLTTMPQSPEIPALSMSTPTSAPVLVHDLKPIREEKSQESLDSKSLNVIDISVEEAITVELKSNRDVKLSESSSNETSTLNSEERTPTKTSVADLNEQPNRYRSVSLDNDVTAKDLPETEVSPRSSSFSGTAMHNKVTSRVQRQLRSGSDPVMGQGSLSASISSQDSDTSKPENYIIKPSLLTSRKKSRSETDDSNLYDRDRSHSGLSDGSASGTGARLIHSKRMRGASTISLGISPKSSRGMSSTPSDASSYNRDGDRYNAWATIKKNRSFKKDMDANLLRSISTISGDRRKTSRSLACNYHRLISANDPTRRQSAPVQITLTRRQTSLVSSNGSGSFASDFVSTDMFAPVSSEDYVGRCLPRPLSDFFKIEDYVYEGSWPDHFDEITQILNLQTFKQHYSHIKERCLACAMKKDEITGKYVHVEDMNRSRSVSKNSQDESTDGEQLSESSDSQPNEISKKLRTNVHKEVLNLVVGLSSAVAVKGTQQEILSLRERYPWAFKDLCLYSQVMEQLGIYSFRLSIRRFIHALFEGVNYSYIFEIADVVLGRMKPRT